MFYVLQLFSSPKCDIWATLSCKDENNISDIRYHENTVTILQVGTRDKRKTQGEGGVSHQKWHPLKAMQKWQTCGFFVWSFLSLFCAFFMLKILIVWKIWLSITADKTKRRHWRQNVIIWLIVQWFMVALVQRIIGFQKKTIGWDCTPVHGELNCLVAATWLRVNDYVRLRLLASFGTPRPIPRIRPPM